MARLGLETHDSQDSIRRRWPWLSATAAAVIALCAGPVRAEVTVVDGGVRFTYAAAGAKSVNWAGEFNGWNTTSHPFTQEDGETWSIVLPLPPGEHPYKFVVDGNWTADPENPVTVGEFGNSVIKIGPDGRLVTQQATSNTALNPKILVGGRFISLFQASEDPLEADRFELRRPDFDLDLDFKIRMSDVLDARMLTNIRSETENVQFFRSRLNFDRGNLHLHTNQIDLFAFDNDRLGTWDDPLHLVGKIGIYNHDFGFNQQGMQAQKTIGGADVRVLYSDNFRPGGFSGPATATLPVPVRQTPAGPSLPSELLADYGFNDTDSDKDVLAARLTRPLGRGLKLGVSGRLDRGFNPGVAAIFEPDAPRADGRVVSGKFLLGSTLERWWGVGGDLSYARGSSTVRAEYLRGRNNLDFIGGAFRRGELSPQGTFVLRDTLDELFSFPIAKDHRFRLEWAGSLRGFNLDAAWEFHGTETTPLGSDSAAAFDNSLRTLSLSAARGYRMAGGRKLAARLGLDVFDFTYDPRTSWSNQFWFDSRNYWLEAGEHLVHYDKLLLLGGRNVLSWKPSLSVDVLTDPPLGFRYAGTFNGVSLDTRPKYIESLFQATLNVTSRTRLYSDTRWVKYDDPVLKLNGGYVSTFLELAYDFTPGITFAASWGVDPFVIDDPVNEYAYIGRDAFLFSQGATGAQAQSGFGRLALLIPAAEEALEDEQRLQLEAIVRF
jgi:hypothetical protein